MNIKLSENTDINVADGNKRIVLAGGCFWGTEAFLKRLPGVCKTFTAYANGGSTTVTYDALCSKQFSHAEAVFVEYNPTVIDLVHLLRFFFRTIDPTSQNRQGGDIGVQYRTAIIWLDAVDEPICHRVVEEIRLRLGEAKIATTVEALTDLTKAERYHQDYLTKNPGGYCHVSFGHLPLPGEPTIEE